jgi:phage N-6-adenine-methyltransferase
MVGAAISRTASGEERVSNWRTPPWFYQQVQEKLGRPFDLDAFAEDANALAPRWITELHDAFKVPWIGPAVWFNPPDVLHLEAAKRAVEQAKSKNFTVAVALFRCGPETEAWEFASAHAWRTEIVRPRLNYIDPTTGRVKKGISKHSTLFWITPNSAHCPLSGLERKIVFADYREPAAPRQRKKKDA